MSTIVEGRGTGALPAEPAAEPAAGHSSGWTERLARRALLERLRGLVWGQLTLREGTWSERFGARHELAPSVTIDVRDPHFYVALAASGSVGAGRTYIEGAWGCDDLVGLVRIMLRNREVLERLDSGLAQAGRVALRWSHARRDNTREGARNNISAHYDVGNDFYRLFLDREAMMYSCAIFARGNETLEQAQQARLEHICRLLDLRAGDRVLEIGTGWGGFALHAASRHGCRVTTTTISPAQHAHASARVHDAGLADRIEVLQTDYRDLQGRFDKLVSIEMIEAVGERWLDAYFAKCNALLEPHGRFVLQAITIRDHAYQRALRSVDFIQHFVFPGSCLPATSAIMDRIARLTDMTLVRLEDIGPHYARTLHEWRARLAAHGHEARALGYSERFLRLWEFYFCYCEGAFLERAVGDALMLFEKPLCHSRTLVER